MKEIRPVDSEDDDTALRLQWQELENQLILLRSASDAYSEDVVEAVEAKRDEVAQDLQEEKLYPSALERLKGRRDEYVPDAKQVLRADTGRVDREVAALHKRVLGLNAQLSRAQDPAQVQHLERQLQSAEAQLKQKDTESYRRQHAVYSAG